MAVLRRRRPSLAELRGELGAGLLTYRLLRTGGREDGRTAGPTGRQLKREQKGKSKKMWYALIGTVARY